MVDDNRKNNIDLKEFIDEILLESRQKGALDKFKKRLDDYNILYLEIAGDVGAVSNDLASIRNKKKLESIRSEISRAFIDLLKTGQALALTEIAHLLANIEDDFLRSDLYHVYLHYKNIGSIKKKISSSKSKPHIEVKVEKPSLIDSSQDVVKSKPKMPIIERSADELAEEESKIASSEIEVDSVETDLSNQPVEELSFNEKPPEELKLEVGERKDIVDDIGNQDEVKTVASPSGNSSESARDDSDSNPKGDRRKAIFDVILGRNGGNSDSLKKLEDEAFFDSDIDEKAA